MKDQEKLIRFMNYKQNKISKLGKELDYFNSKDLKDLAELSDTDAKFCCDEIKRLVKNNFTKKDAGVCPFCILFRLKNGQCSGCPYATRHGFCNNEGSHYEKIMNRIERLALYYICDLLSSSYIRRLLS